MIASAAVGAVAGGLVRDSETGIVVPRGAPPRWATRSRRCWRTTRSVRARDRSPRKAVAPYTYDAMADAFDRALAIRDQPVRRRVPETPGG